jgi:FkbM family methyltransferase
MEIIANVIEGGRSSAKFLVRNAFRAIASFPRSRRLLNAAYLKLNACQKARFHAVSIVGHDIEIKQTYETLISLPSETPELFIDIGANYGTHSLLFLVHGVQTITFEPNTSCHEYFRKICRLNHVTPNLESVALGEYKDEVDFCYPKRDTWLGSTKAEIINKLSGSEDLVTEKIKQRTLDDFFSEVENKRTLIKIDTEGNEFSVLKGATKILERARPRVIFECWDEDEKAGIFDLLRAQNYSIYALPWSPKHETERVDFRRFMASADINFLAVPVPSDRFVNSPPA